MIRTTIYFSLPGFTWNESIWTQDTDFPTVTGKLAPLIAARADLLGYQAAVVNVRLLNSDAPRQAYYPGNQVALQHTSNLYTTSSDSKSTAPPWAAVLWVNTGGNGSVRRAYVSGAPKGVFSEGVAATNGYYPSVVPDFGAALNAYTVALVNFGGGWLSRSYLNFQQIAQLVAGTQAPPEVGIQVAAAFAFGTPAVYKVSVKGFRKVNTRLLSIGGVYKLDQAPPFPPPTGGPYIYYLKGVPSSIMPNIQGQGVAAAYQTAFSAFANNTSTKVNNYIDGTTHRKRGARERTVLGKSKSRA